jgi:hypothetical protein
MRLFVLIALLFLPAAAREFDYRIILKGSRAEATAKGHLPRPEDSALFSFSARAGQHVSIRVTPLTRGLVTQAVLIYPSGQQDGPGTVLNSDLNESGTYRIRVTPREQTAGKFRLYLHVR